jgi:adenylate cyclase
VLAGQSDAQGDKFAGLADAPWGRFFYVAGPVWGADGRPVGAVLVGQTLEALARSIRSNTLAHVTLYDPAGRLLASTLALEPGAGLATETVAALPGQPAALFLRPLTVGSVAYSEAIGVWSARNGQALGWAGTALAPGFLVQPTFLTQVQALILVLIGLALVVLIGWALARHITRPLGPMVNAARAVAQGNFQVKLQDGGDDEVAVLVHAFNQMVSGLQEGSIYRDLLGRAVSPEVREELRSAFGSGNLRLEGQTVTATVLMSDIRGFTTLSEKSDPTVVLRWLNEYFSELVPIVTAHGGVVDKFEGDALLAFFGVLPCPLSPRESAYQACRAALEMLDVIASINARRAERGEPLFITGIGINTGPVTAGGLGASDRLNYTVIGDTVNTTQRLESYTRAFDESAAVVSESTRHALRARQALFQIDPLGGHVFKGKSEPIHLYRLLPAPESQPALSGPPAPVPALD